MIHLKSIAICNTPFTFNPESQEFDLKTRTDLTRILELITFQNIIHVTNTFASIQTKIHTLLTSKRIPEESKSIIKTVFVEAYINKIAHTLQRTHSFNNDLKLTQQARNLIIDVSKLHPEHQKILSNTSKQIKRSHGQRLPTTTYTDLKKEKASSLEICKEQLRAILYPPTKT